MSARNKYRTGEQPRELAPIFAALGDETRLLLISRLGNDRPMSITRLTYGTNVTRQALTKHLEVMRKAGLVRNSRRGRERIWQLERQRLKEARHCLELISKQWEDALGRLKKFVEE